MAAESRLRVQSIEGVTQIEFIDRNILDEANIQAIGEEIAAIIDTIEGPGRGRRDPASATRNRRRGRPRRRRVRCREMPGRQ